MANNADWLNKLNYIDFLRDVGRHFSVNRMLAFNSVKLRLERQQELSFLEFNYMILQAYDFVELNKRTGCVLQMGGSDQWGNIVNGIDLGRRMAQRAAVRAHLAADHHVVRRQDGQDRGRRGLAQRRPGEPVRLLAILAQHRGRRCRPLPQAVHRAAARRDRQARSAARAPRSTRPRRCSPPRRPPWCMAAPRPTRRPRRRARTFEQGELAATCRRVEMPRAEIEQAWACSRPSSRRDLPNRTAKCARHQIKGGGCGSTTSRVTDDKYVVGAKDLTPKA